MRYIEAPKQYKGDSFEHEVCVFLAGGITNCPDWQQDALTRLDCTDLTVFNPRRKDFPIGDPTAALEQIKWEYLYLNLANIILFWFPCETLCPIVLYELGAWANTFKPIYVGVHPDYQRRQDVEIQMSLRRPNLEVVYSLPKLLQQVVLHE